MVGLGAGMMTALQYQAQGNVQWLLVCVVVNLRIFITRRKNSRKTISFRKRNPAAPPPPPSLYHKSLRIAGCGTLEKNCAASVSIRFGCYALPLKSNFKTLTSILANFKYYQDSLL